MKKTLLSLLVILTTLTAQAQLRTSRTFIHQKSQIEWTVRAGISFNRLTSYDKDELDYLDYSDVGGKTGFAVDFGFNKYFKNSNLYWGMELGIGTRGTSLSDPGTDETVSASMYNVKYSPFTIGYKIPVADKIKIDPHLGLYASYDFAMSSKDEYGEWIDELENKFDLGLQFGAGLWYGRVNLDFMYQIGFIGANPALCDSWTDYYIDGGKTGNFLIRLGVSF